MLLFAVACVLRLTFALISIDQLGSADRLRTLTRDSEHYTEAAGSILRGGTWTSTGVRIFGPGYPTFLAAVGLFTGDRTWPVIIVQILLASAGSVLLALFALQITRSRRTALLSGYIHAVSLTAISISAALLSDSLFVVMILLGLLIFSRSAERERAGRAAIAGLILGLAVLTRSVGLVLVPALPLLALLHPTEAQEGWTATLKKRARPLAIAVAAMLFLPSLWIVHNRLVYGVSYLGQAGAINMIRSAAAFRQYRDGTPFQMSIAEAGDSIAARTQRLGNEHQAFAGVASDMLRRTIQNGPWTSLGVYLATIDDNANSDEGVWPAQLPRWRETFEGLTRVSKKYLLRYRGMVLSVIGLWILYRRREYRLVWVLASLAGFFALTAGLSPWQGNRLFYPGQIATAPLAAVALWTAWDAVMRRVRTQSGR